MYLVFLISFFYNLLEAEIKEKGNEVKDRRIKNEANETVHVKDFVNKKIVKSFFCEENPTWDERVASLNQYFDLSAAFHQPKGDGYKLVLNCLHKYLDFKFIRENNNFRFHESLFDQRVRVIPDKEHDSYNYVVSDVGGGDMMDGSRADIYYLLHEADQEGIASRRCISYVNSNRLHLTAVLIQLIERIVDNLECNPLKKYQEYGQLIRLVYMTPENAELDIFELFDALGYKKKKYYRVRNEAITLISETLFGILAGEHGFADLYISEAGIHVNQRV